MSAVQPSQLFKLMEVKCQDSAEKVLNMLVSYLCYMKEGESLQTSQALLTKLSDDIIHIEFAKVKKDEIIDDLSKKGIIKLPV